jgi:hypothetical protein
MPQMRDKIVEVPGVGNVAFPGGMHDEAVAQAIKGHLAQQDATINQMQAENPQPKPYLGLTPRNVLGNVWQGAKGVASGAYELGKDIVTNPNWVFGQDSTFNKFVLNPAGEQAAKATKEWEAGRPLQAVGHELAGALPLVGPWSASLGEQAGQGDIGGAAGQAIGTVGAIRAAQVSPKLGSKLGKTIAPVRAAIAERAAQSLLGPEPRNIFEVSRPAPALVKEGPVAATTKGLLKKVESRISEHNAVVQNALRQAHGAAPEPLAPIVERATQPVIDMARSNAYESIAKSVETWRNNYLKQHPSSLPLDELYKLKQELGKAGKAFRGGPSEEVGVKGATQRLVTEINNILGQRIPGLREITQRESGLITAADMLENKARIQAGGPMLIPGARIFGGLAGESGGLGASGRLGLPGGTLIKTGLVKALGTREPLAAPRIPPPASPVSGQPIPTGFTTVTSAIIRPQRLLPAGSPGKIAPPPTMPIAEPPAPLPAVSAPKVAPEFANLEAETHKALIEKARAQGGIPVKKAEVKEVSHAEADKPTTATERLQAKSGLKRNIKTGKMEKVSTKTGLTKSQTDYLADSLREIKPKLPEKSLEIGTKVKIRVQGIDREGTIVGLLGNNEARIQIDKPYRGNSLIYKYEAIHPIIGEIIKVPGDGIFKIPSVAAANRLLKKIGKAKE